MKRINVSVPEEDEGFLKSRDLSPSKLLQERICQIRDEQNPQLLRNVKELQRQLENQRKKVEFFTALADKRLTEIGELEDKLETFNKLREMV